MGKIELFEDNLLQIEVIENKNIRVIPVIVKEWSLVYLLIPANLVLDVRYTLK